jgi:hypothetical protein
MIFDLAEKALTKEQFQATASHELGHALGIYHRDVAGSGQLMRPMPARSLRHRTTCGLPWRKGGHEAHSCFAMLLPRLTYPTVARTFQFVTVFS